MRTLIPTIILVVSLGCELPDPSEAEGGEADLTLGGSDLAPWEGWTFERASDPARTIVNDGDGLWLAELTDGARTVRMRGPERRFHDASSPAPVTHTTWVRALYAPYEYDEPDGVDDVTDPFMGVDVVWLTYALISHDPDALEIAMQYLGGAPKLIVGGLRIAGDADYGPKVDGVRQEGSDFNDYLGLDWVYPDGGIDHNEKSQLGSLDCSGYMRMVWGYRLGLPMVPGGDGGDFALPRRAVQQLASGPGIVVIPDTGVKPSLSNLRIGDLLFWNADSGDGPAVDHVGMYLGVDAAGHPRFFSSRKTPNGPTFGDFGGASKLDGTGLYSTSFRAARRL